MEYVTTEEAARRLGLTRDGVRQMAKAGRIEHIRVEGRANGATYAIPRPSRRVGTHEAGAAQGRGVAERRRMMGIGYVRKMQGDALLVYNAHEYDRRGVDAEHALIEFVPELGETGVYRVIPFRGGTADATRYLDKHGLPGLPASSGDSRDRRFANLLDADVAARAWLDAEAKKREAEKKHQARMEKFRASAKSEMRALVANG